MRPWPDLAFLGVLQEMFEFLQNDPHDYLVMCFDDRPPKFRLRLWPEYKSHRGKQRKSSPETEKIYGIYRHSVSVLPGLLERLGIDAARARGYEGDDVIGALALRRFSGSGITIISEDLDFIQLCDGDRVRVYHPSKREYGGACPDGWLYRKMLVGDASDNLPGLPGVGPVKAGKLLDSLPPFQGFDELVEHARDRGEKGDPTAGALYRERENLRRQMRVIDLRRTARIANRRLAIARGLFDGEAAMRYPPLVRGMAEHTDVKPLAILPFKRLFSRMRPVIGHLEEEA